MKSVPEKRGDRHRSGRHPVSNRWPACVCEWDFWRFVLAALALVWEIVRGK